MSLHGPNRHAPQTVILVDDEEGMRSTIRYMLELLGFEVITACDGAHALEVGRQERNALALAISDFRMPGMDGVETLKALRSLHPELKVILCSGFPESDCLQGRTLEEGVFLGKPFGLRDLDSAVTKVLG